jgi:hypothetical protein
MPAVNSRWITSGRKSRINPVMTGALLLPTCRLLGLALFGFALLSSVYAADDPAQEASIRQLREIGAAVLRYHDTFKSYPLAGNSQKGTGLSWRVRILPFLGQEALYDKFDLESPWNSTNNRALVAQMPEIYKTPFVALEEGATIYLGVLGPAPGEGRNWQEGATFFHRGARPRSTRDMIDGTRNTIMVVEVDPAGAVIWSKPDDWQYQSESPRRGLGAVRTAGFLALFADGSAGLVPGTVGDETLRLLFQIGDKRPVEGYTPPGVPIKPDGD